MVSFFKNNLFFNSLMLLPLTIVLRLYAILNPIAYVAKENDTYFCNNLFSGLTNELSQEFIAIVLVFFHALYINRIVIVHRLGTGITLIPGLIYIIMASFLSDYSHLTPDLIANTFIIVAIGQLFLIYKKPTVANVLFNVGFWIAVAALFVPSYLYLIIPCIVGLFILRSINLREIFQLLSGIILLFFLTLGIYFLVDIPLKPELSKIFQGLSLDLLTLRNLNLYKFLAVLLVPLFAILRYSTYTMKKSIQSQKKINILYHFMLWSGILLFFTKGLDAHQVLLMFIPLSILLSMSLLSLRNTFVQELIVLIAIGGIVVLNYGLVSF